MLVFAAGHGAHAAGVAVTGYIVINPIDVCGSNGGPTSPSGCAPFNSANTLPNQATSTTPIGFVDSSTNINLMRVIWLQTGIDVLFFPVVEWDNTNYQSISDVSGTTPLYSCLFQNASTNGSLSPPSGTHCPTLPALKDPNCTTRNCSIPLATAKSNAINMFFVNNIQLSAGGALDGFGWINGNGAAIASSVFSSSAPRFSTMSHETGHTLGIDHCTYGAGDVGSTLSSVCPSTTVGAVSCATLTTPGGCNLMDAGTIRNVAAKSDCTTALTTNGGAATGGELYNLDTANYLTTPACMQPAVSYPPVSDFIIPKSADNTATGFVSQQTQVLKSGFINPSANVNATAGGGSSAAPLALSTSNSPTTTGLTITIPFAAGTGRTTAGCQPPQCVEYVTNIVFAFANGISPAGSNALVSSNSGQPGAPVIAAAFNLNGNNGENPNCEKIAGQAAPSVHCYEIQYQAGTFVAGTESDLVLNLNQNGGGGNVTNPQQLLGSQFTPLLETDQPLGTQIAAVASTSTFECTLNSNTPPTCVSPVTAGTTSPDPSTPLVAFGDPSTFTGTPYGQTGTIFPCTPPQKKNGSFLPCPPLLGGDNHGKD
jgi:hypothetical protein